MKKYTDEELEEIIRFHGMWRRDEDGGKRAMLQGAYLRWVMLQGAMLQGACLYGVNLEGAMLQGANLEGGMLQEANLYGANLQEANLRWTMLQGANLQEANLRWAMLQGAMLQGANLRGSSLRGANLQGAILPDFQICPQEGAFIAYKKVIKDNGKFVIKLQIPASAKRTSCLVSRKCRASKAKPTAWWDDEKQKWSKEHGVFESETHEKEIKYEIGKMALPDGYDDDIRVDCTQGIHFFMTFKEAKEW